MIMKHLTNSYDPRKEDAREKITRTDGETQREAWARWQAFLSGTIIGRPKATEAYTVEQLEAMGMVGIYAIEIEEVVT